MKKIMHLFNICVLIASKIKIHGFPFIFSFSSKGSFFVMSKKKKKKRFLLCLYRHRKRADRGYTVLVTNLTKGNLLLFFLNKYIQNLNICSFKANYKFLLAKKKKKNKQTNKIVSIMPISLFWRNENKTQSFFFSVFLSESKR